MFDLGWSELFIIAIVALIVIGPRDLPQAMRMVAGWVRKARSLTREFQSGIESLAKEAELDEVKADIKAMVDYNPDAELKESLDPGGKIAASLPKPSDIYDESDDADGKTEEPDSDMDVQNAMDGQQGNSEIELDSAGAKEPDVVTAGADAPAAAPNADGKNAGAKTEGGKQAGGDAPLGTVMGPVPDKDTAKAG